MSDYFIYGAPATDEDKINSFILGRLWPSVDEFQIANNIELDIDIALFKHLAERLVGVCDYTPDQLADIAREAGNEFKIALDDALCDDVPTPAPTPPKRSHLRLV